MKDRPQPRDPYNRSMVKEGVERIGPYRVEQRLGSGGMGEVYKAYDDRLDRWVAIKRIRADREQSEDNRARFRREARAAARLNHSAIVHVYDIFSDGEADCIVMELVEGQSLERLLKDGPLEPFRAAEFGRQIASGLAEAHAKGLLHRDLKTENVIVTEDGQAKILDFGLAKPMVQGDLDASLTGKGQVVGTSRAMSPEYVGGDAVDHRADLFSLGVLLYETATGSSPFRAHNTLATLKRIILHKQAPAHEANAAVPLELSALIETLLEKEPEDRPDSAREVEEVLARIAAMSESGTIEHPSLTGIWSGSDVATFGGLTAARRWRRVAVALLVALIATAIYFLWIRSTPAIDFEESDQVIIGDFVNKTGEDVLDEGLNHAFRMGLEQGRFARVVPPQDIRAALQRMELPPDSAIDRDRGIELAVREGAKALVLGTIVKVGSSYSLTGEIIDPENGRSAFVETEQVSSHDRIIASLDGITRAIRANLGESLVGIESSGQPLARVTTSNLEALKAYSRGSDALNRHLPDAIDWLSRAVELDPEFAMAHARLGTAHLNHTRDVAQTTAHYLRALEQADRLTDRERLYVEGWVKTWHGTPDEMISAWSRMATLIPDSFEAYYNLGMVSWSHFDRLEEAATALLRAAELAPRQDFRRAYSRCIAAYCQLGIRQVDEALAGFEATKEECSPLTLFDAYLSLGDLDLAEEALAQAPAGKLAPGQRDRAKAYYLIARGRSDEAREVARSALEGRTLDSGADVSKLDLDLRLTMIAAAQASETSSEVARMARELAEALAAQSDEALARPSATAIPILAFLSSLAVRHDDVAFGKAVQQRLRAIATIVDFPIRQAAVEVLSAEILLAEGRQDDAIRALRASLAQFDSFDTRARLADLLLANARPDEALVEAEWVLENRGRSLADCAGNCFSAAHRLLALGIAPLHAARLYDTNGDAARAAQQYEAFVTAWEGGDRDDLLDEARERVAALGGAG